MRITIDLIESGRSRKGAWTRRQLALLGVKWPPPKGWKREVIGNVISEAAASEFTELKDCHLRTPR